MQFAVNDAIARGDVGVERMAIRAASPLTARMSRPVASTRELLSLELKALAVLKLARPLAYSARVYVSLDGGDFVQMPEQVSGKRGGFRHRSTGHSRSAARVSPHRVRARLTFGDPAQPAWTEVRDLPPLFYALYDLDADSQNDARRFIYAPAGVTVRELDPLRGQSRRFVVDVPAQSSAEITLDAVFPQGFGFVGARAMQIGEHAPDTTAGIRIRLLEDACAFQIVNPHAAPPRYAESLGATSMCRGR